MSVHQHPDTYAFRIFACGSKGGSYAADLTSFLIAERHDPFNFISMDVGTSLDCIKSAAKKGQMINGAKLLNKDEYDKTNKDLTYVGYFRKKQLNGFLVTHAHLDHTAGLVISSAEDDFTQKPVLALEPVIDGVKSQFSKPSWPGNFWYNMIPLEPKQEMTMKQTDAIGAKTNHFQNSQIKIKPYKLSHATEISSVFLVCTTSETNCVLFFGDTGPDKVEKMVAVKNWINFASKVQLTKDEKKELDEIYTLKELESSHKLKQNFNLKQWGIMKDIQEKHLREFGRNPLHDVWLDVMDKIKGGALNTIFIECSYTSGRPDGLLFGHLTPKWIVNQLTFIQDALRSKKVTLSVVVTHIKPTWNTVEGNDIENEVDSEQTTSQIIENDLNKRWKDAKKNLEIEFIVPQQTDMIYVMEKGSAIHVSIAPQIPHNYAAYGDDHDFIPNANGHGTNDMVMVYFAVLISVVVCCFLCGLLFGGSVGWIKQRKTRRVKEDN